MAAHVAGFGTSHTLGGTHGSDLIGATLAALVLLLVTAVLWVAFGRSRRLTRAEAAGLLGTALPNAGGLLGSAALLAAGGIAAFAGIELLEGHAPLAGWAPLLVPLCALLVAWLAPLLARRLAALGVRLAALAGDLDFGFPRLMVLAASAAPSGYAKPSRNAHRGRAPPQ
jgi:hypothetical protein